MITYARLGKKASSFSDPVSRMDIAGDAVVALTSRQRNSPKTKKAFIGGHLTKCSKAEYDAWVATQKVEETNVDVKSTNADKKLLDRIKELESELHEKDLKIDSLENPGEGEEEEEPLEFKDMDDAQLLQYYKENYEITAAQEKAFKKLDTNGKVKTLEGLEEE